MKLSVWLGVFLLLGCVLAQNNQQKLNRNEERKKFREEMKQLRKQRRENRRQNTYKWTVVLDDEMKTEVKQGAFVNTINKTIIFWSASSTLEGTGYNRTVMMQDNEGLVAVIPKQRGHRGFMRQFTKSTPTFVHRTTRQAQNGDTDLAVPKGESNTIKPFRLGRGRGQGQRKRPDKGRRRRIFKGRGRKRNEIKGGRGSRVQGRVQGRGQGQGKGRQDRRKGQGLRRQGLRRQGLRRQGLKRHGLRGIGGGRFAQRFGARRAGGPCYIIPAKMTYEDTISMLFNYNATGKVDITAQILDFVTPSTPMTGDMKSSFTTTHPNLAKFCGERAIFDAQTMSAGSDLSIQKAINVIASWGRFKIRIKEEAT